MALQARDLSTNFMAADDGSKAEQGVGSKQGEEENKPTPEPPRPKGAPNRFLNSLSLLTIGKKLL